MYNRWVKQLVATGMDEMDAKLAIQNLLGGLSVNEVNGMVTASNVTLKSRAAEAEANLARAAAEVAQKPALEAYAPPVFKQNRNELESFLANETEPPTFQYKGTQGAPLGLQPRARVASIPGLPAVKGGRSRKNRKSSRKSSRKNRKSSRKH
jgi:hypothetical protein